MEQFHRPPRARQHGTSGRDKDVAPRWISSPVDEGASPRCACGGLRCQRRGTYLSAQPWDRHRSTRPRCSAVGGDTFGSHLPRPRRRLGRCLVCRVRRSVPVGASTVVTGQQYVGAGAAADEEIADIDRVVSAGAWAGDPLAAVGFAFRSAGGFDVVAEPSTRQSPSVVSCLRMLSQRCCGPLRDMPTPMLSSTLTSPIRTYSQCLTASHTSPQTPSTSSIFSSGVVRPSRGSSRFQTLSVSSSCNSISQSE